jgi:hypothetical protein
LKAMLEIDMLGPDWWFDQFERLEAEYGYEPTGEEVDEAVAEHFADQIDRATDEDR